MAINTLITGNANAANHFTDMVAAEIRQAPGYVNMITLSAGSAADVTVPAGAVYAAFNACNTAGTAQIPFFMSNKAVATAVVPTSKTDGTGSEFMPTMWNVATIATLSAISPSAGFLVVTFYSNM